MLSIFLYFLHLGFLWSRSWIKVGSFQQSQVIRFAILKKEKKNHLWPPHNRQAYLNISEVKWSKSHSVVSASLWPHRLCSPWNSPGQNTGVGSPSLLQGIVPTQGSHLGLPHCRRILYQLSHKGRPQYIWDVPKYPISDSFIRFNCIYILNIWKNANYKKMADHCY